MVKSLLGAFELSTGQVPRYAQKVPGNFNERSTTEMSWYQLGEFSSHKRAKRDMLGRDWYPLIWEQRVIEAHSETHLGPPLTHSQPLTKK